MDQDYLHLAVITAAHGVRGEVKIKVLSEELAGCLHSLSELNLLSDEGHFIRRARIALRGNDSEPIARLSDVTDRETALTLRGYFLSLRRDELPPLPAGRYYICDLIGLRVIDRRRGDIGQVKDVLSYRPNDILEIAREGKADLLMPISAETFFLANLDEGTVDVVLPDGLWEIYD